jgi:hypothetical protein
MPRRELDPKHLKQGEDWVGNNAAFTCPVCADVFLVSGRLHPGGRKCPGCEKSVAFVEGGKESGGRAFITWPD